MQTTSAATRNGSDGWQTWWGVVPSAIASSSCSPPARTGRSGVLVVSGEAGVGKTVLLEHARAAAAGSGFRVESSTGAESESQLAFAGLHQLCAPLLDHLSPLPEPQQAALGVAFGLRGGAAPDTFLVGLAILNLLSEAAEAGPLLCVVDDAQWLDHASAQILAFVARRLAAEPVALVLGLRDADERGVDPFAGLPELPLGGLDGDDARALLVDSLHVPIDAPILERIVAEARGNPLALLELPQHVEAEQLAGGFERPDVLSVPRRVEESFRRRSASLPPDTQLLMLAAAAEPTGDGELLWRAAAHLGIAREAAAPAERSGLLTIDTGVHFRHPLVRSAVYRAATPPDRRRAHAALAAATEPRADPDRRAWHRAQSTQGTDEEVAIELERSAGRARARGGLAAAAAFLQRAAELTPDPADRATRALQAAHAKHAAGASETALELLTRAEAGPLDAVERARLELLRAQVEFHLTRGSEVSRRLLDAAQALAPLDAALSRETYMHALEAAIITGGLGLGEGVRQVAEAAAAAPAPPEPARPADLLLDGLVTFGVDGYEAGVPELRRALQAFRGEGAPAATGPGDDGRRWLWLASRTAVTLFDDDLAYELATRNVQLAREAGALAALPAALVSLSVTLVLTGELAHASELVAEEAEIRSATGAAPLRRRAELILAGWRGRPDDALGLASPDGQESAGGEAGTADSIALYARSVLHNGLGRYDEALDAATRACESDELLNGSMALPELIEAAARAGQPERAVNALEQLGSRARVSGTEWGLGLAASSRALLTPGPGAEAHHREAIERLARCRMTTHRARAHLVYGEWLRRERRRQDAREHLRIAHRLLSGMGADGFAERAARELQAIGDRPRKRAAQPTDDLTAHELHIARLVATGATNREVAAHLFLSPRTIEAHLRSIFRKLDITSRRQLKDLQLP